MLVIAPLTRSVEKDLETQIVVVTSNEGLRDRLQRERDDLFKHGTLVNAQVQYQFYTRSVGIRSPNRKYYVTLLLPT